MITVNLSPQDDSQRVGPVSLSFAGTVMTLDDFEYDLSETPDGADAIASVFRASRNGSDYTVTIRFRHLSNAPESSRFPEPITVTEDGPVTLPPYGPEPEQEVE